MNPKEMLAEAKAMASKPRIEEYRETVQTLREKGYTWREIADFLNERGISTDHTRIYRTFGKTAKQRRKESREIQISKITYKGVHRSKKKNVWHVMELLIPSKLGESITVVGYAWGKGGTDYELNDDNTMIYRNTTLVIKAGDGFPMSYVKLEFKVTDDQWSEHEVYIMPKWETLF